MKDNGGERSIDWWPRFENWGSSCPKATVYYDRVRSCLLFRGSMMQTRDLVDTNQMQQRVAPSISVLFYHPIKIKKPNAQFNPV